MTDHHDSNHNDTNAGEEHPNTTPRAGHDGHDTGSNAGDDLDWAAFAAEHANDLQDVERSRNARRFEKHAQRKEKEALLSVDDLDAGTFTDDKVPLHQRGPRDHGGRSWLDTDDVMDEYGDDFVPPNPKIGRVIASKLVFWILLVAGVAGIIASVFVPALATFLGSIFGLCALVGAPASSSNTRGTPRRAPTCSTTARGCDDGARPHRTGTAMVRPWTWRSRSTCRTGPRPCRNRRCSRRAHTPHGTARRVCRRRPGCRLPRWRTQR